VFVFTPNGDVQNLPAGATPIDFAYAIHSAVGNRMVGAKVNNRIVTLDHILKNGDIVEIMTAKNAKGPSRDWMSIAASSQARSKIRQWFKKERRDENIANGRAAFESELRHAGLSMASVVTPHILDKLLRPTNFKTLDDLYAAIGYGGYTAQKAVNRVREEVTALHRAERAAEAARQAVEREKEQALQRPIVTRHHSRSEKGIIVEGLDNCLVKFAKCCTPVPGDEIVGFISRGYGVSVHRKDCPNASEEQRSREPGRWISVSWGEDTRETYNTSLEVICKDRRNLLVDISTALSVTKAGVSSLNVQSTTDGFAIFYLSVQVSGRSQLDNVMNKLYNTQGVIKVSRTAG